MSQGDKSSYTDKQKRQAEHIEAGYEKRGVGTKIAEARAWATVNKLIGLRRAVAWSGTSQQSFGPVKTGGGKKSGSGRKKTN